SCDKKRYQDTHAIMSPEAVQLGETLGTLLTFAWLLPLAGFAVEIFGGFWGTRKSRAAAYLAVFCIGMGFVLSVSALLYWGKTTDWAALAAGPEHAAAEASHAGAAAPGEGAAPAADAPHSDRQPAPAA